MKREISRRTFLKETAIAITGCSLLFRSGTSVAKDSLKEARYYVKLPGQRIRCELCPWQCMVEEGKRGICEVRENRKGIYYSLVYGHVVAQHLDPIEKKPFFHFLPSSTAFSIATVGCNFNCKYCQNWDIAQRRPEEMETPYISPEEIVRLAKRSGSDSVAYTYTEPVIFTEFVYDVSVEARKAGLRNVIISNGFISQKPLLDLTRVIDGYKVDLKAFEENFYRDIVEGMLQPVLDTLITLKAQNVWTEIVYLVVPTLNDQDASFRNMAKWVLKELGPDVPVHFSRFYPQYKLQKLPPTPTATLERAWNIAREVGLHYVYLGNIPGHPAENTYCPNCNKLLIRRRGFLVMENFLQNGRCSFCGQRIPGVWS